MNEYNDKNIMEEQVNLQELPEQKMFENNNNNIPPEEEKKEEKDNKGNNLVKILILIIILLLLTNACGVYHYKKEIDTIKETYDANAKCKTPEDKDKDIKDPDDEKNKVWKIKFMNPIIGEGSVKKGAVNLNNNTALTFSSELIMPGDYFTFSVDVYNYGEISAKLGATPKKSSLTESQSKYLLYDVRYSDGTEINADDLLEAGETKTLVFKVEFMSEVTGEDLPQKDETINLAYELTYIEK